MTLPGYFWDRWPYFAGKLSWDITTTQVNSALHPSGVTKSSTSFGWGKGGKVTTAGWQVTLCDLIWHVISRSGVVISITNCYIQFTLPYLSDSLRNLFQKLQKSQKDFLRLLGIHSDHFWALESRPATKERNGGGGLVVVARGLDLLLDQGCCHRATSTLQHVEVTQCQCNHLRWKVTSNFAAPAATFSIDDGGSDSAGSNSSSSCWSK